MIQEVSGELNNESKYTDNSKLYSEFQFGPNIIERKKSIFARLR